MSKCSTPTTCPGSATMTERRPGMTGDPLFLRRMTRWDGTESLIANWKQEVLCYRYSPSGWLRPAWNAKAYRAMVVPGDIRDVEIEVVRIMTAHKLGGYSDPTYTWQAYRAGSIIGWRATDLRQVYNLSRIPTEQALADEFKFPDDLSTFGDQ